MTSRKQRQLEALRWCKHGSNFWVLVNMWKERGLLPEDAFFSVLVHGPPKTFKSKILGRFKLLWPKCKIAEHHGQAELRDIAGYDLVIHAHRLTRVAGNWSVNHEAATVDKSRFFAQPWDTKHDLPIFYDLLPFVGPW